MLSHIKSEKTKKYLKRIQELFLTHFAFLFPLQLPTNKDAFRKTWNPKYTLRSHFDGVRALAFHPVEPVLVTVSEDHTLKLWNLQKTVPAKKQVLSETFTHF